MTTRDREFVLFLCGESLPAGSVSVPEQGVGVWCRDYEETTERTARLRPCCIVLDVTGRHDATALVHRVREAAGRPVVIVTIGTAAAATNGADCHVASRSDLLRLIRFAMGESLRSTSRVACSGAAFVEFRTGEALETAIVDVCEGGVCIDAPPGFSHEEMVRLRLRLAADCEFVTQAHPVRRIERDRRVIMAFRFVDLAFKARSSLRAFLLRSGERSALLFRETRAPGGLPRPAGSRRVELVGESPAFKRALDTIERVAPTDVTVLLLGETGTGKELAARALHEGSRRTGRPFVAVNCAALPESLVESELFGHEPGAFTGANRRKIGRIEQASSGTLFLDEIGDLPAGAQAKLLRALQERVIERVGGNETIRIDVRLIAATNQDLEAGMAKRTFRRDLFFRLNVVAVTLPPLRERIADIPVLAEYFLRRAEEKMGKREISLNAHAHQTLATYPWPGNIRELENVCTRVVALAATGATLGPEHLALLTIDELANSPLPSTDLRDILDFCEREVVKRTLNRHGGNRTRTARALGISRQTLQQKLARFRAAKSSPDMR